MVSCLVAVLNCERRNVDKTEKAGRSCGCELSPDIAKALIICPNNLMTNAEFVANRFRFTGRSEEGKRHHPATLSINKSPVSVSNLVFPLYSTSQCNWLRFERHRWLRSGKTHDYSPIFLISFNAHVASSVHKSYSLCPSEFCEPGGETL